MDLRESCALGGALAGLWLFAIQPSFCQETEPAEDEPVVSARGELERVGATIRAINIEIDNVFDLSDPNENKKLYRWANKVHIRTRPSVIESVLLFEVGDRFLGRLLDESARTLRARGYLADAVIEPRDYDPVTNSVVVDVHARDSWSLAADLKLSRGGGATEWGVGLSDGNLFGTGKEITVSYTSDIDRNETYLGYSDANVFDSRVRLSAALGNASDGHRREIVAERPFYALDTPWALGGSAADVERVDTMYDLGEEIDEFRHDIRSFSLHGGWSRGVIDRRTHRWLLGIDAQEDTFEPTPGLPQPLLLPADRKLVYPWIAWHWLEHDYRQMSELNDMGRTEDISLGLSLYTSIGFARKDFGSDRDANLLNVTAQMGWEPGGPGRLFLLGTGASTRDEDEGLRNSQAYFTGKYYRRNLQKHLFSVSLNALLTDKLDPENQVLLGGDNGLRGYPLRYQAGERRAILTVEQRFFTALYPWRLFRVGYAIFADAGRVEGVDPRATPPLGTLYDVGVGLRLTSPRSSGGSVVHIDLAFPLNGGASIDKMQLNVETKGSF